MERSIWPAGTIIDDYRIEELLGEGGQCLVYRAWDLALLRPVALKVVQRLDVSPEDLVRRRARLEREARALARVESTRVARVYGLRRILNANEPEQSEIVVALEFCAGNTLARLLQRQRHLSVVRALELCREIAFGMQAIHDVGLVHRDLKPHNVIVNIIDGTEHVKVIDLGIAKGRGDIGLTRQDSIVGTLGFMSPEQLLRKDVDGRADIYAFGAILYRMLTGVPVFAASTLPSIVRAHVSTLPTPLKERAPHLDIPDGVAALALSCLAKSPEERPESFAQIVEALTAALTSTPLNEVTRRVHAELTPTVRIPTGEEAPSHTTTGTRAGMSSDGALAAEAFGVSPTGDRTRRGSEGDAKALRRGTFGVSPVCERTSLTPSLLSSSSSGSASSSGSLSSSSAPQPRYRTPKPVTMFGVSIHDEHTRSSGLRN